jgi:hypothetical protein
LAGELLHEAGPSFFPGCACGWSSAATSARPLMRSARSMSAIAGCRTERLGRRPPPTAEAITRA